jgi:flagellar biogenesis protein FliO
MTPATTRNRAPRRGLTGLLLGLVALLPTTVGRGAESGEAIAPLDGARTIQVFEPGEEPPAAAAGLEDGADRAEGVEPGRSTLSTLARTGVWLGLVVLLLCGLVAAARRILPKSMGMFKSPAMELMGRSFLDPKRCVYLLKVGSRVLVVGSAENGLTCLSEITDRAEVEHLGALADSARREGPGEAREFARMLGGRLAGLGRGRWSSGARAGSPGREARAGRPVLVGAAGDRVEAQRAGAAATPGFEELKERIAGLKARLRDIS